MTQPELSPIERLAEHLSARPMVVGDVEDVTRAVADWLDYSLNRCGLVVVPEQSLTGVDVERVARAIMDADTDGPYPWHDAPRSYREVARAQARAAIAAMRLQVER